MQVMREDNTTIPSGAYMSLMNYFPRDPRNPGPPPPVWLHSPPLGYPMEGSSMQQQVWA